MWTVVYDIAGGWSESSRRMSRIVVRFRRQQICMIRHSDGESGFSGVFPAIRLDDP